MHQEHQVATVALDWGTTHRRAYALSAAGLCLNEHADADGSLACQGRFPGALTAAITALGARPELVLMAGMVGSALGWQQVPYVGANVPLEQLTHHLASVALTPEPAHQCLIVPGYCVRDQLGQADVMRGEETQLLGAVVLGRRNGWFVLPGTHSKWVELEDGRVRQLRTYMTGELFGLLRRHGTLASPINTTLQTWDASAFAHGVQAGAQGALSHTLFSSRAQVVCGDMPAAHTEAYLSGLLIGTELLDIVRRDSQINRSRGLHAFTVIGSPALSKHYQTAAQQLGLGLTPMDAKTVFVAAMAYLQSQLQSA